MQNEVRERANPGNLWPYTSLFSMGVFFFAFLKILIEKNSYNISDHTFPLPQLLPDSSHLPPPKSMHALSLSSRNNEIHIKHHPKTQKMENKIYKQKINKTKNGQ